MPFLGTMSLAGFGRLPLLSLYWSGRRRLEEWSRFEDRNARLSAARQRVAMRAEARSRWLAGA